MKDLIIKLEEKYGTIDSPKESITDNGISIISYVDENKIVSKSIDKSKATKVTIISTTPIDFTLKENTIDEHIGQFILPQSQITVIQETGETEDFKTKKITTEFPTFDDYNLNKPSKSIEQTAKETNGVLVHTDIEKHYNPHTNNVSSIEVHKHYVDDLSVTSISNQLLTDSSSQLIKEYSKKIILENTTDQDFELTEESANYKTIEKDLNFYLDNNPDNSLFKDSSFKEYVKSQDGEYHILNQSTRMVKRGDVDEFLVEDDKLIFVSGGFLNHLQRKNIIDEAESIRELKQYADEIGATSPILEESNIELLDDFSM